MGFLSKMGEKAGQEWAKDLTPEQIEEYERQGLDMSEYKVINEEYRAEQQRIIDANDLNKLDKYKKNRSVDDEFVNDVAKFNKLSDKKKQKLETAPLMYGRVVQAHSALYKSNPKNKDGAGIMFVYALDDAHRYDEEWLAKTANRISEMIQGVNDQPETTVEKIFRLLGMNDSFLYKITVGSSQEKKKSAFLPEDCRAFIRTASNDSSSFCLRLGESLSDGADAFCATYSLWDQSKLPNAQIPHNKIIPFLLIEQQEGYGGISDAAQLIPPAYYTK